MPPIRPDQFTVTFGAEVGGILAFDIFIANSDRHARNLSAEGARYNLFDHSHTIFGGSHHGLIGSKRIDAIGDALVIDAGKGGNKHCLLDQITDDRWFEKTLTRIEKIPDYWLTEVAAGVADYLTDPAEIAKLTDFLIARRSKVRSLIQNNKAAFPAIKTWSFIV